MDIPKDLQAFLDKHNIPDPDKKQNQCICLGSPDPKYGSDVCCPVHGNPKRCEELSDLIYKDYNGKT